MALEHSQSDKTEVEQTYTYVANCSTLFLVKLTCVLPILKISGTGKCLFYRHSGPILLVEQNYTTVGKCFTSVSVCSTNSLDQIYL